MTQPAHGWRSHYALLILLFVYTMSFIDRQIMGILVQPIKQEFGVSDTAMGVLTGVAFALFYSTLAIPFGRYADRANRRNFVAYCCAAWSAMTALCGMATGFWTLALARVGVAVGEA
ncbi:MAG: MFS transporter, partial [Simplicispira sp.]